MPSSELGLLIRDCEVDGAITDCRVAGGVITELAPGLAPDHGQPCFDADGGVLLPGLADHHIHLFATSAALRSLDLAGSTELTGDLGRPIPGSDSPEGPSRDCDGDASWLRVIGAGREFDRADVDAAWPNRPVRVQHRSGALWTLNSAAIDLLAEGLTLDERRSGQLWRADQRLADLLRNREPRPEELAELGAQLASWGVTHLTDATPDLDESTVDLLRLKIPQHLMLLGDSAAMTPAKLVIPDHVAPDFATLTRRIASFHDSGRPVAVHAVTAVALAIVIAALKQVGVCAADRIEHAAVCSVAAAVELAELGVTVVTQPGIMTRQGINFYRDTPEHEHEDLWRYATLLRLGVRVAISSDAPYAAPNPWRTLASAVRRELPDGSIAGAADRVSAETAMASMYTPSDDPAGEIRVLRPGAAADLCLLQQGSSCSLADAGMGVAPVVRLTLINGHVVHQRA